MEIKGKRILITCREDDSRPFYFLIKDWMKYNEVAAYFIIADHVVIGRPGFNVRDECKPKGIKM